MRVWDPHHSKLSALYHLGSAPDLTSNMKVLYLGASHGTTVSHVADYVGVVYAVEMAAGPMQDLLALCAVRRNIIPLFADAARPERYMPFVEEVDLVYQDIAQRDQAGILIKNLHFLKQGGDSILIAKTRSIDVTRQPLSIVTELTGRLETCFRSVRATWLSPYHTDHAALVCEGLI
jgi:fibrillarin-like pre-rRNA processing protein